MVKCPNIIPDVSSDGLRPIECIVIGLMNYNIGRNYQSTNEVMLLVQWYTKPMQG